MSVNLPGYPAYCDSSIEWLDQRPSEWSEVRFKYLTSITTGDKDTVNREEDGAYPFFVRSQTVERISTYSFDGEAILTAGDGDIGKIFHHYVGKFDFHQRVYKFSEFEGVIGRFLYYYLSANLANEVIKLSAKTTVDSLRMPMLLNFKVVFPAEEEQSRIANFLDYETAKIEALIEKQQLLIALLKEKRQAVISHAVTKGVNPDTPMRDSGVEWLGEIPAHWGIVRAKYLLQEQNHQVRPGDEIVTSFRDGQVCLRSRRRSTGYTMAILEYGYQGIRQGDLVVHSMDAFAGAIGVSEDDGRATPEYVVVRPFDKRMQCEYYAKILRVMAQRDFIFVLCPSVRERAPRFRFARLQEVLLPVPPPAEQAEIVAYLSASHGKFTSLLELTEDQVAVLQERRTALISAAVTGKIDVRGWTAPESEAEAEAEVA